MENIGSPKNKSEELRTTILFAYLQKEISGKEAAFRLGVSLRQFFRLKKKFLHAGPQGLSHGNKGKKAWNKTSKDLIVSVQSLLAEKYQQRSLLEIHKIIKHEHNLNISYSTLRRIYRSREN